MFSHNRFEEADRTKLGKLFKSTFDMPSTMADNIEHALPIWVLLGLTEEEYSEKYPSEVSAEIIEDVKKVIEDVNEEQKDEVVDDKMEEEKKQEDEI